MKRIILLLLAILLWGGTSLLHAQAEAPFLPSAADVRCKQWVDSVFSGLNLQEKVGQLIVTTFPAKADKQKKKQIRDLVKKYKIGGLLFAEGTPEEQAILTNIAQKNSKVPVMITFDGEWGLSMRLEGTPYFPKNAALGCIEDNQLIYEYGREVAREFRELGVHVNFAPDADVNTNPLNPVIHVRSFGEDPKKVAEKVLAYSRGLESGGVLSVSKHFPGHGDTDVDSHKGLPVLYYNRERLDSVELYPFREMVRAGLGVAMNSGTQAAKEAGNMVDLDNDPTKLIEIVEIGKQLLMTRGTLTTFSIANDVAKYFAIIPALFMVAIPQLAPLNIMGLHSPESAILSAIIFNAIIIPILIPLALKGVQYKPIGASALLRRNLLIYGLGGVIAPFIGIKLIDMIVSLFFQ